MRQTPLLRGEGHEVHAAYDAREALDQVLRHAPDVLVLDIALRVVDILIEAGKKPRLELTSGGVVL